MRCRLCGDSHIEIIHKGTRDRNDIDVMRCQGCGLVFLSKIETSNTYYEDGDMRADMDFLEWRTVTKADDERRFLHFKEAMKGRAVMDFGCGNGQFLDMAKRGAETAGIVGVEKDSEARNFIRSEGIECYEDISQVPAQHKYDIIFMFHVIEHLAEPEICLGGVKRCLSPEGNIIIETPNADDALLSMYGSKAFADFTYWSPHIFLYNESTLTMILERAGLEIVSREQIQRYPLANHLRWLAKGLPGGGMAEYQEMNVTKLNEAYTEVLQGLGACDTLLFTAKRGKR